MAESIVPAARCVVQLPAAANAGHMGGVVTLHREQIRCEIASITPLDLLESQHRADALVWVDSGAPSIRQVKPATSP